MTAMFPFAAWLSGTNQNSIPANDNALRSEVLAKAAEGVADSEPVSPAERELWIVGTTWGGFATNSAVIYISGTWYEFAAFEGWAKVIDGTLSIYDGANWASAGGGGYASVNTISGTTHSLLASNASQYLRFTNAGTKTLTVQDDADEPLPSNAEFHGRNAGAGDLTIAEDTSVTINPPAGGTLVIPNGGTFTLKRVATDEFDLFGVTVAA